MNNYIHNVLVLKIGSGLLFKEGFNYQRGSLCVGVPIQSRSIQSIDDSCKQIIMILN